MDWPPLTYFASCLWHDNKDTPWMLNILDHLPTYCIHVNEIHETESLIVMQGVGTCLGLKSVLIALVGVGIQPKHNAPLHHR